MYDEVKLKIQNFYYRDGGCMLSVLIKKRKCLYRNIPVIKFCYTRKRERERMKGKERERERER